MFDITFKIYSARLVGNNKTLKRKGGEKMKKYIAIMTMFMLVFVLGMRQAEAIPTAELKITDGFTTLIIADNSGSDTFSTTTGAISYSGIFSSLWSVTVSTGTTKPINGSATSPIMHLSVSATSTGATTGKDLTVWFSDIGFTPSVAPSGAVLDVDLNPEKPWNTSTTYGYTDASNALYGTGTAIGPVSGDGIISGGTAATTPYSMSIKTTIHHDSAGTSSLDATMTVPEPATLLLMGAGLLGIGIFGRKKIKA